MNVDYNALEGLKIMGEPITVLSKGNYVIKDRQFVGKPGNGKYLKCGKFNHDSDKKTNKLEGLIN